MEKNTISYEFAVRQLMAKHVDIKMVDKLRLEDIEAFLKILSIVPDAEDLSQSA